MLLDDFLQGFLHELFVQKWHRFGKHFFYALRAVEATLLFLQLLLAFRLKDAPLERSLPLCIATLVLALLCTAFEAWVVSLWWRNEEGGTGSRVRACMHKLKGLRAWLSGFGVGRRVISYMLTVAGCVLYYQSIRSGRAQASGAEDEPLWALFAIGISFQTSALLSSIFVSPDIVELGVFSITIERMFEHDVAIFLLFIFLYMVRQSLLYPPAHLSAVCLPTRPPRLLSRTRRFSTKGCLRLGLTPSLSCIRFLPAQVLDGHVRVVPPRGHHRAA